MRDFVQVATSVKDLIPTEDTEEFVHARERIDRLIRDISYAPPEYHNGYWGDLGKAVTALVGPSPIKEDWKIEIVAAVTNLSVQEIRTKFGTPT